MGKQADAASLSGQQLGPGRARRPSASEGRRVGPAAGSPRLERLPPPQYRVTPGLRAAGDAGSTSLGPRNAVGTLRDPEGRDRGRGRQRPRGKAGGGGWRGPTEIRERVGRWAENLREARQPGQGRRGGARPPCRPGQRMGDPEVG